MWGFAGILSFGHAAYFGLGAYTYAIASMNVGESTGPLLLAIVLPAAVAAVIGAMMFYGRISDVYMGVITLVVTLILFKFMNATAGDAYGSAARALGGFNGIPAFPILNVPGDPSITLFGTPFYYVVAVAAAAVLSAVPLDSAARLRAGADRHPRERGARRAARLQRAGLQDRDLHDQRGDGRAGRLPVRELGRDRDAGRVQPRAVGRGASSGSIVGGLGTLVGPIVGAIVLGYLKLLLGQQTMIDNSLVLGAILVAGRAAAAERPAAGAGALARAPRPGASVSRAPGRQHAGAGAASGAPSR